MSNDLGNLGLTIKALRTARGLTQDEFARMVGLTPQAVSKWETGVSYPDITMLPAIADALGVGINALFGCTVSAGESGYAPSGAVSSEAAPSEAAPSENYPAGISEEDRKKFSETLNGARLICVVNDCALYSSLPVKSSTDRHFEFEDGSNADMYTGTVVNYGHGSIFLAHYENEDSRRSNFNFSNMFGNVFERRITREFSGAAIDSVDLELAGCGDVELISGDEGCWRMTVEAIPALFNNFVCEEKNGCLRISTKKCTGNVVRGLKLKLFCGFTQGEELKVGIAGSGDVKIGPDFEDSSLRIAGSGDIFAANIGNADIAISGSGDVCFNTARALKITVSGSGDVSGSRADGVCSFKIAGSGDIAINEIAGQLEVGISGSGDVSTGGRVSLLKLSISGAGDFSGKDLTADEAEITLRGVGDAEIGLIKGKSVEKIDRMSTLRVHNRG